MDSTRQEQREEQKNLLITAVITTFFTQGVLFLEVRAGEVSSGFRGTNKFRHISVKMECGQ